MVLIVLSIWGLVLLELGCGTPHACRRAFIDSGPKGGGRPACLARSSSRYILLCIPMVGFNSSSRIILHVSLCSPRIAPAIKCDYFFHENAFSLSLKSPNTIISRDGRVGYIARELCCFVSDLVGGILKVFVLLVTKPTSHGNFFYSTTLVNTDSLGMVKSLQHSRYRDVAMRVMASYTQ